MTRFRAAVTLLACTLISRAPLQAQQPNLGRAVAMTETELLVGQSANWYGPGVVYTYALDAAGRWQERSQRSASDTARMDDFGHALAFDDRTLIVGAPRKAMEVGRCFSPGARRMSGRCRAR